MKISLRKDGLGNGRTEGGNNLTAVIHYQFSTFVNTNTPYWKWY